MVKKRVTSKQVAQHAGVSQTTVSFVLNKVDGQNISPETTQRVLQAAHDLGYVPDAAARTLARGISDNVGLVLTQPHEQVFSDVYVPYIITGLVKVLRQRGFRILVELADDDNESATYMNLAYGKEVSGLIVIPYNPSKRDIANLKQLTDEGFPVISLQPLDKAIHSVTAAHVTGARMATEHLIKLGHRKIATISYAPQNSNPYATARIDAYQAVLAEHDIQHNQDYVQYGAFDPDTGYNAAKTLMALEDRPTAIFALNDMMAFGAMTAIHELGLRVPDDVAVVGFDDIRLAAYTSPALTTINAPDIEQGQFAADMLLKLINGEPLDNKHIELQPELIIRESCGYRQKHAH